MRLEGVYTAIVTPFQQDGSVDEKALREFVDFQIDGGVSGLVPVGTTGESPTVTHEENLRVIAVVVEQTRGRVPVIAGTGSNSTQEAINMTRRAKELGADGTLQVAPYYNKPSQEGMYRHFSAIADATDLPLIVYNIPGRTGKNVENDTMLRLSSHPNIIGVKEASGDIPQMMDLIARKPADFVVISGDDNLAYPLMALGGSGVISVASNMIPDRMSEMVKLALAGKYEAAREAHYKLLPLFRALFSETNPVPVKYGLSVMGRIEEVYRLPLCAMDDQKKQVLKDVMRSLGLTR
ncbi:MAG TPA: 4-hydroxy-tetrahydrodipicolinate synthase [Spirochaetia bacterium]|nr:4-hydroxy-tetrahydrodipicolinate synthase [Spirochaetia bacterium]